MRDKGEDAARTFSDLSIDASCLDPRAGHDGGEEAGGSHALSELRKPRYAGEGFAADRGLGGHPPPPRLSHLQFPFHHLRARAVARTHRDQAQRPARAVRPRQADALGADRAAQAPVEPERIEQMVSKIVRELESGGENEVSSEAIGETVMAHLRDIDDVAYVRFASVYRNFGEVKDFRAALDELSGDEDDAGLPPRPQMSERLAGHQPRTMPRFMQLALSLGRRGLGNTWPNPAVGAVIVKDGVIVGRGWTQPGGRPHAEVEALHQRQASGQGRDALL